MARQPRIDMPLFPQHVIQRGNNRQAIFFQDADYVIFLGYLRESLSKYHCRLYAYALLTNHFHLLVVGEQSGAVSLLMQSVGRRYVRYINKTYQRTGTLFEGRYKSSLIDSERYLLTCMRYIELNPVRASMVKDPVEYRWSSYAHHTVTGNEAWISEPPEFTGLGLNAKERRQVYRKLCTQKMDEKDIAQIRQHLNKGKAWGSECFQQQIETVLGRSVKVVPQGRPRKQIDLKVI